MQIVSSYSSEITFDLSLKRFTVFEDALMIKIGVNHEGGRRKSQAKLAWREDARGESNRAFQSQSNAHRYIDIIPRISPWAV